MVDDAECSGKRTAQLSDSELSPKSRRSFLGALLAVGGFCVGALLSVPLIRFALFPLLRRPTELKESSVGALTDFSSLTEPVMRTIQIEQVDGWRKAISEKAVYVTKDSQGQLRVLTSICPHLGVRSHITRKRSNLSVYAMAPLSQRTGLASADPRCEGCIRLKRRFRMGNSSCDSNISDNWFLTRKS